MKLFIQKLQITLNLVKNLTNARPILLAAPFVPLTVVTLPAFISTLNFSKHLYITDGGIAQPGTPVLNQLRDLLNTPVNANDLRSMLEQVAQGNPFPENPNTAATAAANTNIPGPLDQFNVTELVGLKFELLGKFYLAITNISLYLALVLVVIIAIFYFGDNDSKLVPNKWSIVLETLFASIKGMVKDQIGLAYEVYLPLIFSIFFFFLTGNLISNIPYSFAANASAVVSIGYSLTFFMGVTITSLFNHGNKFFRNFIPQGTPLALVPLLVAIEFTSYTARGFSLGVRMFANLFSGHCLLAILSVFGTQLIGVNLQTAGLTVIFALPIFLAIIGLEVAVSFIQTFVLSLLSCSYVRESIVLH
jgi:F-type H+-transporting ATPase subunit a